MKRTLVRFVLGSAVAVSGLVVTSTSSADAATVYNRYYCNYYSKACYQVNGNHNYSVGCDIHMKHSGGGYLTESQVRARCAGKPVRYYHS